VRLWLPTVRTGTGAETYTRRLAEGLAARGHDVQLDIVPHRFQYAPWLAGIRPRAGTDVILANSWNAAAFAGAAPLVTVVHLVVHDPLLAPHKNLSQALFHRAFVLPMEKAAVRRSAAVIAVSENTAEASRAFLDADRVEVVLNGVDTTFFRPPPPRRRDREAPIELLFVGKPSLRKGFDLVAAIVDRLGADCRLTCAGLPPSGRLPRPPGRYLGYVSPVMLLQAYQAADLLLFPSRLEGFGYVAAEALACGVPVVCTEGTAVAEIAPAPACGIACPADDVEAFAEAIRRLRAQPDRLSALREDARDHAVDRLGLDRWLAETERVLAGASGSASAPGASPQRRWSRRIAPRAGP